MRTISCLFYLVLAMGVFSSNVAYAFNTSDISAGVFRFQIKLAEQGNPEAQYKVGEMYEQGKGVPKDMDKAKEWFKKSAKQGHRKANYKLLYLEVQMNGLNDVTKTQVDSLRKEAAAGVPDAQYFLGKMYASGIGVPKSLNNALAWLNKATFNGISEAEHEAIAVDEELARIREKEAKQRAEALEEARKKREAKDKAKQEQAEKEKRLAAQRAAERKRIAAEKRAAEERQKQDEQARLAALRAKKKEQPRRQSVQTAVVKKEEATSKKEEKKATFVSDPCKGKSARFLSTCR